MLLPIITEYNEADNTISATTDCLGTYCVMDMGDFLSSIAALEDEEETEAPAPMLMSLNAETSSHLTVKPEDEFNVVFAVDTRFAGTPTWDTILDSMSGSAEEIFKRSPNATIYVLEQNMPSVTQTSVEKVGEYTNFADLTTAFEEYRSRASVTNLLNQCDMSAAIDMVNKDIGGAMPTFVFSFLESDGIMYNSKIGEEILSNKSSMTEAVLVLSAGIGALEEQSYAEKTTNKKNENVFGEYACTSAIVNYVYSEKNRTYNIISATNYEPITLEQPITRAAKDAAEDLAKVPNNRYKYADYADTDKDGLYDFEEINFENDLIKFDTVTSEAILPTFAECTENINDFYVDTGLEAYKASLNASDITLPEHRIDQIVNTSIILPIYSNPYSMDSDGEGILDSVDDNKLKKDYLAQIYIDYINKNVIKMNTIRKTDDGFTMCITPLSEIFNNMGITGTEEYNDVDLYFDDWYIFSVSVESEITYSILKMREVEGAGNSSVAIPFIEFDISLIEKTLLDKFTYEKRLDEELGNVTEGRVRSLSYDTNNLIVQYFSSPYSKANYLIAEEYINKIIDAEYGNDGVIKVQNLNDRLKKYVEKLEFYDKDSSTLKVNKDNLSLEEKQAILAVRTANTSFNSFAAEVIYHADKTVSSAMILQGMPDILVAIVYEFIFSSAVKADMGVGEEKESGLFDREYYNYNARLVKKQREIFGDI